MKVIVLWMTLSCLSLHLCCRDQQQCIVWGRWRSRASPASGICCPVTSTLSSSCPSSKDIVLCSGMKIRRTGLCDHFSLYWDLFAPQYTYLHVLVVFCSSGLSVLLSWFWIPVYLGLNWLFTWFNLSKSFLSLWWGWFGFLPNDSLFHLHQHFFGQVPVNYQMEVQRFESILQPVMK